MIEQSTYCSLATSGWDDRSKRTCCLANLPSYKNFSEMHQDEKVKNLVRDLSTGKRNPICNECWKLEDNNIFSMRQQSLQNEGLAKSREALENELHDKKLKYIVLDSGQQCNFACRTCGPYSSTGHNKEYLAKTGKEWKARVTNFEAILDEDLGAVKTVEVLGGEPFLNLDHLDIIDKVKNSRPYWLTYTTNASVKIQKEIYNRFSYFKAVNISLSIDAVGKQFDYIRTLGRWNKVEENINLLLNLKKQIKHLSVSCHITISALNVLYLDSLIGYLNKKEINFDFTFCEYPNEYALKVFTPNEVTKIIQSLKNINGCDPVILYLEKVQHDSKSREDFFRELEFTKSYRKLDYKEYLPKLSNLIMQS
jgi:molybdenum cofactor biosynthesis enzyme MoaA